MEFLLQNVDNLLALSDKGISIVNDLLKQWSLIAVFKSYNRLLKLFLQLCGLALKFFVVGGDL
jgi:hypothetical protein